jgi:hypothetical protein
MTEDERLRALTHLAELRQRDEDIASMVTTVMVMEGTPSVGHLARQRPEVFDALYEQAVEMNGLGPR